MSLWVAGQAVFSGADLQYADQRNLPIFLNADPTGHRYASFRFEYAINSGGSYNDIQVD